MKPIKFFCEGITDQIFIADCLEIFYKITATRKKNKSNANKLDVQLPNGGEIIDITGCSNLSNDLYIQMMKETKEQGGINIVFFDADHNNGLGDQVGNNGFKSCSQKLEDIKVHCGVEFEYFIWPNHDNDGDIETLLRKLIPQTKEPIFSCIESHTVCLNSLNLSSTEILFPDLKNHINAYLHLSFQSTKLPDRKYKDSIFWNLNHEEIEDLKKIKVFLDRFYPI